MTNTKQTAGLKALAAIALWKDNIAHAMDYQQAAEVASLDAGKAMLAALGALSKGALKLSYTEYQERRAFAVFHTVGKINPDHVTPIQAAFDMTAGSLKKSGLADAVVKTYERAADVFVKAVKAAYGESINAIAPKAKTADAVRVADKREEKNAEAQALASSSKSTDALNESLKAALATKAQAEHKAALAKGKEATEANKAKVAAAKEAEKYALAIQLREKVLKGRAKAQEKDLDSWWDELTVDEKQAIHDQCASE